MKKLWFLVLAAALGCDETASTGPIVGGSTTRVVVWPTTLSLGVAQSFALETTLNNPPAGSAPTFTCTSNLPSVATVDNCVIRSVSAGTATIAVTSNPTGTPASVAVTVSSQTTSCPTILGTHVYRTTVTSDADSLADSVAMRTNMELQIVQNTDGSVVVSGLAPFVNTSGVFSLNCEMSTVGTGVVEDVSNVGARLTGPVLVNGVMTFRYTLGTNGALPGGQPLVYTFTRQ